eukprot:1166501-Prymnesium_polylepis.1
MEGGREDRWGGARRGRAWGHWRRGAPEARDSAEHCTRTGRVGERSIGCCARGPPPVERQHLWHC